MTKKFIDQIIKIIGFLLTIIALMFVGKSIWIQKDVLLSINLLTTLKIISVGVLAYFLADMTLAIAWKMLLNWFGEHRLGIFESIRIYGKSQILKYIPGNLLSIPGRHILSIGYGAKHGPLVGAATFEIIGLVVISSTVSVVGLLFEEDTSTELSSWILLIIFLLSLASPLILRYALSRKVVTKRLSIFKTMAWGKYSDLLAIWMLYSGFFAITGFILLWIIIVLGKWDTMPFYTAFSIFAISWLLGTIIPGAPAGLGIRESIIILLLSAHIGERSSILVSLIMRVITMIADILFYLGSLYLEKTTFKAF